MPAQPRGRACSACQSIKIKCELGAPGGGPPPCQRCTRLNKQCTLAAPKRQKDRVAELEAQVEALTKMLGDQGIQEPTAEKASWPTPSTESSENEVIVTSQKKRKLPKSISEYQNGNKVDSSPEGLHADVDDDGNATSRLDRLVSTKLQQRVLDEYITSFQSVLPVVPLASGTDVRLLRETMPHTLHAIVYIASCGVLSWDLQDQINLSLIEDLTSKALAQCKKSLDILLALQLVCLWYRSPRNSTQIPLFQLVHIASDMAIDLGFGGYQNPPSLSIVGMAERLLGGVEACRLWLISFIISDTTAILKRKPNDQKWTLHHDKCLHVVETSARASSDNQLLGLAQAARAAHVSATISDDMDLHLTLISPVVGTPSCQQIMHDLQDQITVWRVQVPIELWSPSLMFDGFYMELLLYEPVLYTPTNKQSFAAPFLIERLSVTDVPTPPLTQHHIDVVRSLKSACHNLLDVASRFTATEAISLPTMIYAPRVVHAVVTLLKLHIAITIQGNTYGQALGVEELMVDAYLDKCLEIEARATKIDAEAVMLAGGQPAFYDGSRDEQSRDVGEEFFNEAAETGKRAEGTDNQLQFRVLEDDAAFADFINPEFAMDDYGLLELFSDSDLSANAWPSGAN